MTHTQLFSTCTKHLTNYSLKAFEECIAPFRVTSEYTPAQSGDEDDAERRTIRASELAVMKERTYRQLRTRELLLENSQQASLVVLFVLLHCQAFV